MKKKPLTGLIGLASIGLASILPGVKEVTELTQSVEIVSASSSNEVQKRNKQIPIPQKKSTRSIISEVPFGYNPFVYLSSSPNPFFYSKRQKKKGWQKEGNLNRTYRKNKCVKGGRR